MPALTPAEVQTRPSRMKMGSQSTISSGCSLSELAGPAPVGGDPPPGDQPRRREQEDAAADRRHPAGGGPGRPDPVHERAVRPGQVHSRTARHDQRVDPARVQLAYAVAGVHGQSAAGPHRPRRAGHHLAVILRGQRAGVLEHLVRPGQVERLEAIEDHEDDAALAHFLQTAPWRPAGATTASPHFAPSPAPAAGSAGRGLLAVTAGLALAQAAIRGRWSAATHRSLPSSIGDQH